MSRCPHCATNTIGPISKFWSDAACPVRCPACGGLAYLRAHETALLNAIVYPGCFFALAGVIFTNSFLPLLLLASLWLLSFAYVLWGAPLSPISEAQAAQNKSFGNIFILLIAGIVAIWWVVSHG